MPVSILEVDVPQISAVVHVKCFQLRREYNLLSIMYYMRSGL